MKLSFTYDQQKAIEAGDRRRKYLQGVAKLAAHASQSSNKYRHYFIYGPSGIGKTYNIEKAVKESGVNYEVVSGASSMYGFFIDLVMAKYAYQDEKVVVIIDDCDALFKNSDNINIMKELLGEKQRFTYNVNIHPNSVGEEGTPEHDAMLMAQKPNGVGYEVDCSNFSFIITSNNALPNEADVEEKVAKNGGVATGKLALLNHMLAIATRVMPKNCMFTKEEKWGNIVSIAMEDAEGYFNNLTDQQKIYLLDFMWVNWDRLTQSSVRTAEQMAQMFDYFGEEEVRNAWEIEYIA